jgi:hypothetical protein
MRALQRARADCACIASRARVGACGYTRERARACASDVDLCKHAAVPARTTHARFRHRTHTCAHRLGGLLVCLFVCSDCGAETTTVLRQAAIDESVRPPLTVARRSSLPRSESHGARRSAQYSSQQGSDVGAGPMGGVAWGSGQVRSVRLVQLEAMAAISGQESPAGLGSLGPLASLPLSSPLPSSPLLVVPSPFPSPSPPLALAMSLSLIIAAKGTMPCLATPPGPPKGPSQPSSPTAHSLRRATTSSSPTPSQSPRPHRPPPRGRAASRRRRPGRRSLAPPAATLAARRWRRWPARRMS